MKIIRPESEKKEVPLVSGGVYTDQDGDVRIALCSGDQWRFAAFMNEPAGIVGANSTTDDATLLVQEWTYHPNAVLVLEPKP